MENKERNKILNSFGEKLMYEVRDYCLDQFNNSIEKEAFSENKKLFQQNFRKLNTKDQEFLKTIVIETVDSAIHYFLWMIEQHEEYDLIKYKDEEMSGYISLREISDELCGELYTEDGWIEKFSKYPPSIK